MRGAPENVGEELRATHPVIRTNPVTGWRSVFAVAHHVQRIDALTDAESKGFLDWFVRLIVDNHDLQVRHRWVNRNDLGEFGRSEMCAGVWTDGDQRSGIIGACIMLLRRIMRVWGSDRGPVSGR